MSARLETLAQLEVVGPLAQLEMLAGVDSVPHPVEGMALEQIAVLATVDSANFLTLERLQSQYGSRLGCLHHPGWPCDERSLASRLETYAFGTIDLRHGTGYSFGRTRLRLERPEIARLRWMKQAQTATICRACKYAF